MAISVPIEIFIESICGNRTAESEGFKVWVSSVLSFCMLWGAPWLYWWCRDGLEAARLSEWIRPLGHRDAPLRSDEVYELFKRSNQNDMTASWVSCCLVTKSCLTLCDPMDCSTPGFPVLPSLLEFPQSHVRRVGDAIQPSHSLSSPSPPAFNLSQHQGLFQWVSSSHQVAKGLELQL